MSKPPTGTPQQPTPLMTFARDCWLRVTHTDFQQTLWTWQVATGVETGNPEHWNQKNQNVPTRNDVRRDKSGHFVKTGSNTGDQTAAQLMATERSFLFQIANKGHDTKYQHISQHINKLRNLKFATAIPKESGTNFNGQVHSSSGTQQVEVATIDVGSNLNAWAAWSPLTPLQGVPVPLFAHPVWLASLTHHCLLILQRLAEAGIAHTDFWNANLCLADWCKDGLLQHTDLSAPVLATSVSLTHLPLRAIDWELVFAPAEAPYVPVVRYALTDKNSGDSERTTFINPWVSPRLANITARTAEELNIQDHNQKLEACRQRIARQMDGRVDLWTLGWMLRSWIDNAREFWREVEQQSKHGNELASQFTPAYKAIIGDLFQLGWLPEQLEAHAPDQFSEGEQWTSSTPLPHQALRNQLESLFPVLRPMDKPSIWPLWLINPAPVPVTNEAHAPPKPRWQPILAWGAKHRKPLTTLAAAALLAGAGWHYREPLAQAVASSQTWAQSTAQTWAVARLDAQRQSGTWWANQSATLALGLLANVGTEAMRDQAIVASLSGQPRLFTGDGLAKLKNLPPAELLQAHDEAARGAQQLASLSAAGLQQQASECRRAPDEICLLNTLVTRLYATQKELEKLPGGGVQLTTGRLHMPDLLHSLNTLADSPQPLARMLWVQYAACSGSEYTPQAISDQLDALVAQWPSTGQAMPAAVHRDFVQPYRQALATGAALCEAAAPTSATPQ